MLTSYVPVAIFSSSLRKYSFRNVGRPAVRIHTWKCSSWLRSGRFSAVYPSGYRARQYGGGTMSDGEYVVGRYFFASPGHAMPLSVILYVTLDDEPDGVSSTGCW